MKGNYASSDCIGHIYSFVAYFMAKPTVQEIDYSIGLRLKRLRVEAGLSAAELAEGVDSTQQQISRYETGKNKLSAAQLFRLAFTLGVPISWFFLDFDSSLPSSYGTKRAKPVYDAVRVKEELDTLKSRWPMLQPQQRLAILRLLDSF